MEKLYLVTGAAGHLGSVVVRQLLAQGCRVRALVLPNEANAPQGALEIYHGDVCSKDSLRAFFAHDAEQALVVIHCAGIVSIASRYNQKVFDVNVTGTKNIVDLCVEYGAARLVHVSSVHAIPEQPHGTSIAEASAFSADTVVGLYAQTKAQATAYVLQAAANGLHASVVHPSGICGPYDNGRGHLTTLVTEYCRHRLTAALEGGYDFVDVRDVANGIVQCCEKGGRGECYILSNRFYTMREILTLLHDITGQKAIKTYLPLWFVRFTAPLAEKCYALRRQPPLFTAYSIYTLTTNAHFSHAKAEEVLGYTTRDMRETLVDTVAWLREKGRI